MVHEPFTIKVTNGSSNGQNCVSSVQITLNSATIFGPSDFNQNISNLETLVALQSMNTITIQLASQPGAFIEVSIGGVVDGDQTTNTATALIDSTGGSIKLGNFAQLFIPPGALSTTGSVQVSSVTSPLMDFLLPDLGPSFTPLDISKVRIKSSEPFALPLRLQLFSTNSIPEGSQPAFIALNSESGADQGSGDILIDIGGDSCGDGSSACVTLLPEWFMQTNPADPNDPVLQIGIGFRPVPNSSLHLWLVPQNQVQPAPGTLNLSSSQNLTVSARIILQKNFELRLGTPLASNVVRSPFGPRPSLGGFHSGVDLAAATPLSVLSVLAGNVDSSRFGSHLGSGFVNCPDGTRPRRGLGNQFWILHGDGGLQSGYGHLDQILVHPGQLVDTAGQRIAITDSTGGYVAHTCIHGAISESLY